MKLSLICATLIAASTTSATTITGISYSVGNSCVTTLADACAGIGVTDAGSTSNPFLNDLNTKAINLEAGSYLTFNEPFFTTGSVVTFLVDFSDSTMASNSFTIPSADNTIGTLLGGGGSVTFATTSLVADRMSFGPAPGTFTPNGNNDTIIEMDVNLASSAPEPGTFGTLGFVALGLLASGWRKRKRPTDPR